jgi:hypothetical protein
MQADSTKAIRMRATMQIRVIISAILEYRSGLSKVYFIGSKAAGALPIFSPHCALHTHAEFGIHFLQVNKIKLWTSKPAHNQKKKSFFFNDPPASENINEKTSRRPEVVQYERHSAHWHQQAERPTDGDQK